MWGVETTATKRKRKCWLMHRKYFFSLRVSRIICSQEKYLITSAKSLTWRLFCHRSHAAGLTDWPTSDHDAPCSLKVTEDMMWAQSNHSSLILFIARVMNRQCTVHEDERSPSFQEQRTLRPSPWSLSRNTPATDDSRNKVRWISLC